MVKEGRANPSSCTGQLDRELPTAQHSHQRIELRDARDAVRQPELRSQLVRGREGTLARKRFIIRGCLLGGGWVGGTTATTEC